MELPGPCVPVSIVPCRQGPSEAAPSRLPVLAPPHASSLQDLSVLAEVFLRAVDLLEAYLDEEDLQEQLSSPAQKAA